ncbi:HAD family hydrolase [Longispora albida]|uniref:HAD family hydrolase n=1 Tax=Longispora albida TaxID=203523 RepID=UPI00035CF9E7|nr:HAD family phosphatase [Longispora albida]
MKALITDFGGVLTSSFLGCLSAFDAAEGLPPGTLASAVASDLGRDLERGAIGQREFEEKMAVRLGVAPEGLLARMAAALEPDEAMLAGLARIRAAGVRVAILSNSWGTGHFDPYRPFDVEGRADVVVISDQVRLRKPDPRIFELTVARLGVPATACVFVDDVKDYLVPAARLGMTVVHHRDAAGTLAELDQLLDL